MRRSASNKALIGATMVVGGLLGIGGTVAVYQFVAPRPVAENKSTETPANQEVSVESGLGMTPPEMFEHLETVESSFEFEWKYLNYLLLMRNNETAMHRILAQRSDREDLTIRAEELSIENQELVNQLYTWQKLWGHTHH